MRLAALGLCVAAFAWVASAQENRYDAAITGAAVFSKQTSTSNGVTVDTPTKSGAFTGTVRYHLTPKHAVDINVGRTRNSQIFSVTPNTYRVLTSITEFTADYAFSPKDIGKVHPFLLAGGGALRFSPVDTFIDNFTTTLPVSSQTVLAFLYGGGVDYPAWRFISVRLQYRGFFFREPDFGVPALFFTGARGHLAEPSAGFVVRF